MFRKSKESWEGGERSCECYGTRLAAIGFIIFGQSGGRSGRSGSYRLPGQFYRYAINEAVDIELLAEGDVFICSFYAGQDNEDFLYQNIDFYIRTGSACCIALDEFVPHFPQRVLDLANQNHYPILHIDGSTPYGELIRSITLLIFLDQDEGILENWIGRIVNGSASSLEISHIYQSVVPKTALNYVVFHTTLGKLNAVQYKMLKDDLSTQLGCRFLPYFEGGFLVFPGESTSTLLEHIALVLSHYNPEYSIGYSEICSGLNQFPAAFGQALSADETARSLGIQKIGYESLSVYKLLIPLQNSGVLKQFCEETLSPLQEANLIETVETYLGCDGNIEQTAQRLAQHKNTIRFRMNKSKALLGLEHSHCAFIEKVSLALKGRKLL